MLLYLFLAIFFVYNLLHVLQEIKWGRMYKSS